MRTQAAERVDGCSPEVALLLLAVICLETLDTTRISIRSFIKE
jgi:hypothetical protein